LKHLLIKAENSIKDALKQLSKSGNKCLVVIDEKEKFKGTLSDGDVRKAILKGKKIIEPIKSIYNNNATFFYKDKYTKREIKDIFINKKFDLVPIINNKEKIIDIITWHKIFRNQEKRKNETLDIPVVIMAGGKGTRMQPFTKVLPKPLIPIHDKPIIEHIIDRFSDSGCSNFYLTVNYKGKLLKAYFEELNPSYKISFVEEHKPLGTAGSLSFLKGKFNSPLFVTNCDIIIKANYQELYQFHQNNNFDITLVASAKEHEIPYGTCELDGNGFLSKINEKPKYDFLINTGLYILESDVIEYIPKNKFFHITHLIEDLKKAGKKIGVFPVDDDDWVDIGQWAEYKKAINNF